MFSPDSFTALPEIRAIGERLFEPQWALTRHLSACCELLLVQEGSMRTVLEGRRSFVTEAGGMALLPSGTRHRDVFDLDRGLNVFMVAFRWEHEGEFFRRLPAWALHPASGEGLHTARRLCRHMRGLLASGTEFDRLFCSVDLLTILLALARDCRSRGARSPSLAAPGKTHHQDILDRTRAFLDEHFAEELTLDRIARALGVSPFHLSHVFSRESDFGLIEYLTDRRMRAAEQLIRGGLHSVKEVACAVGYKDSNYFARVFRRHFGHAPSRRPAGGSRTSARNADRITPR